MNAALPQTATPTAQIPARFACLMVSLLSIAGATGPQDYDYSEMKYHPTPSTSSAQTLFLRGGGLTN
mgnify:CR=1 FL=1